MLREEERKRGIRERKSKKARIKGWSGERGRKREKLKSRERSGGKEKHLRVRERLTDSLMFYLHSGRGPLQRGIQIKHFKHKYTLIQI